MYDRLFSLSKAPTCEGGIFTKCMSVPRIQFVLLLLLSLFLCTIKLDDGGLAAFDECFYAQKAKEIALSGDWLTQRYVGEIDHQNPWLHMWVMAASFKVFGISEWSARFPTCVETILIVLLTYLLVQWLTRMPWVSMISASSLLLSEYFFKYAKKAHTDHLMALFFLTAMIGYVAGRKRHQAWYLLTGLSIGLAILTKSVLGLMPAIVVCAHIIIAREWSVLKRPFFWLSIVVAIVVGCSWYAYEYARFGDEFVHQHFEWQVLSRSVYRDVSEEGVSFGSFVLGRIGHVYAFMKDAHIWFLMAVLGAVFAFVPRKGSGPRPGDGPGERLLLLLWFLLPIVLVSFASDFKGWYLMPVFVPMAILSAFFLARIVGNPARLRIVSFVVLSILFLHLGILTVTPIFTLDLGHDIRHPGIRKLATKVRALGPRVTERVMFFPATAEMAARYGMTDHMSGYFIFSLPWNFYSDHPVAGRGTKADLEEVREYLSSRDAVCLTTDEGFEVISEKRTLPFAVVGRAVEGGKEYVVCCSRQNYEKWRVIIETDYSRPPLYSLRNY
jgi:4-amino-4-deoxy-L-arabinose transferase-like glycosyltransferase